MWTTYHVRWEFITRLYGSVPGESKLIAAWLAVRAPRVRPPASKSLEEIAIEVIESVPEQQQEPPTTLIFQRVNGVLAMRMATVKAHLKDCAYQLQTYTTGYVQGEKGLRVKVANGVYWPPGAPVILHRGTPFVPILHLDGTPFTEPSGVHEKPVHITSGPQGPRNALKAMEFCEEAAMEFRLAVLTAPDRQVKRGDKAATVAGRPLIDEDDMKSLMLYGGVHGYAGERSEDGGRYAFAITKEDAK